MATETAPTAKEILAEAGAPVIVFDHVQLAFDEKAVLRGDVAPVTIGRQVNPLVFVWLLLCILSSAYKCPTDMKQLMGQKGIVMATGRSRCACRYLGMGLYSVCTLCSRR